MPCVLCTNAAMSLCSTQLSFSQLTSLLYAFKHFPESTLKRWELVADFVHRSEMDGSFFGQEVTVGKFEATANCCRLAYRILLVKHHQLLSITEQLTRVLYTDRNRIPFKQIVLLPGKMYCCETKLIIKYVL